MVASLSLCFSSESLADALLKKAWISELGIDKVSSLITRVAVSVAQVSPEVEPLAAACS